MFKSLEEGVNECCKKIWDNEYQTASGTNNKGFEYEVKITALFSTILLREDIADGFVAGNVSGLGSLDDIVLNVHRKNGCNKYFLFQLKHKNDSSSLSLKELFSLNKQGDKMKYSIFKYYEDYKDLKTKSNSKHELLGSEFAQVQVVLYTNRTIDKNIDFLVDNSDYPLNLLNKSKGKVSKIQLEKFISAVEKADQNDVLINRCKENEFKHFAENLFIMSGQSHSDDVEKLVKAELSKYIHESFRIGDLTKNYILYLTDWARGNLRKHFTITKAFVTDKIVELVLSTFMIKSFTKIVQNSDEDDDVFDKWEEIMSNKKYISIKTSNYSLTFLSNYLVRKLNQNGCSFLLTGNVEMERFFSGNITFEEIKNEVQRHKIKNEQITINDLYCASWRLKLLPLILIMKKNYAKKLLQSKITQKSSLKFIICSDTVLQHDGCYSSVSDLVNAQRNVLLDKPIKLQGKTIQLAQVEGIQDCLHNMEMNHVIRILRGEFEIGQPFQMCTNIYIPQKVPKVLLKFDVLNSKNIFLIESDNYTTLKNEIERLSIRYITYVHLENIEYKIFESYQVILTESDCFNELIQNNDNKTIHHIFFNSATHQLEWIRSHGNVRNVLEYRHLNHNQFLTDTDKLLNYFRNPVNVISANPGMGKSTYFDYVSKMVAPNTWVLRVNLINYLRYFNSSKYKEHSDDWEAMLKHFNGQNSIIDEVIFDNYLKQKRVLILLDGFDEASPWYKDVVTDMIRVITRSGCKIVLTTRPVLQRHVEVAFSTLAMVLSEFDESDQRQYLTQYFSEGIQDLPVGFETSLNQFVRMLLAELCTSLRDDCFYLFTGIPLQCLLLAEVYIDDCESFVRGHLMDFEFNIDMLDLYERFISKKINIWKEKLPEEYLLLPGFDLSLIQKMHALEIIFSERVFATLNLTDKQIYYKIVANESRIVYQKDGITIAFNDIQLNFLHRTFAEYFAALWLSENYQTPDFPFAFLKNLFDANYDVVRIMFDRILNKKSKLASAVLNRNLNVVKQLLTTPCYDINSTDDLKRTPLHLTAAWGKRFPSDIDEAFVDKCKKAPIKELEMMVLIIKQLIENGADATLREALFDDTPLDLATRINAVNILEAMFNFLGDEHKQEVQLFEVRLSHLYYCCCFDYVQLFQILSTRREDQFKNFEINKNKQTILHVASFHNSFAIVQSTINNLKTTSQSKQISIQVELDATDYQNRTPLLIACLENRDEIASLLVNSGAAVNLQDEQGNTCLMICCRNGNEKMASMLLGAGCDANVSNKFKQIPLHVAYENGFENIVRLLIENGASVDVSDVTDINTVLHKACQDKNVNIVKYLTDKGANLNLKNKKKDSPVHVAYERGFKKIVEVLLKAGADVNVCNKKSETLAHVACQKNDTLSLLQFIKYGANLDLTDFKSDTPLEVACHFGDDLLVKVLLNSEVDIYSTKSLRIACKYNNVAVVPLLLDAGAEMDVTDLKGNTALHLVCKRQNEAIARMLIENGANLAVANSYRDTPLIVACHYGSVTITKLLLEHGADVYYHGNFQDTALHTASRNGHATIVEMLVENSANTRATNKNGDTLLHIACREGHEAIVSILTKTPGAIKVQNIHKDTPIHVACKNGFDHIAQTLISAGADLNSRDSKGNTPLIIACEKGNGPLVKLLLDSGADPNVNNNDGQTALLAAYENGHHSVVSMFFEGGVGRCQNSILHHSIKNGKKDLAVFLIHNGIDVDAPDAKANTPLHLACAHKMFAIVSLLVKKGAKLDCLDSDENTPLQVACQLGNVEIVDLLMKSGARVHNVNKFKVTTLRMAQKTGNKKLIALLKKQG